MLVAISGGVTCSSDGRNMTNFGCNGRVGSGRSSITVYVTSGKGYEHSIAPKDTMGGYNLPGYNADSPFIEFSLDDYCFETDTEYNLWYAEDMEDNSEDDNGGTAYTDIYVCPAT